MISRILTFARVSARELSALAFGFAATVFLAAFLDHIHPTRSWLIWSLLALWGWDAFLTAACASFGHFVLTRLLRVRGLPTLETVALSLPIGLVCFVMGQYAGGFLALYGPTFAVALPTAMLLLGLPAAIPQVRSWVAKPRQGLDGAALAATLFGTLCLGLMYLELMTPDALNYDSTWYHLVVAEDYAREGRIVGFQAHWPKCLPHLTGLVNVWSFTLPGLDPPLRWMMALHTEFTVFLWTLVSVAATVRWLCEDVIVRGAWATYFLFPGILVYDGNIGGSADHFLALFSSAIFLAAVRVATDFQVGAACAMGMCAAGATLCKFQSAYSLVVVGAILVGRLAWDIVLELRGAVPSADWRRRWVAFGAFVGTTAVFASPHFIENFVRYRNPVYPLGQGVFNHSSPTMPGAPEMVAFLFKDYHWHPPAGTWPRLRAAIEMLFTFSFTPHYSFVDNLPCFGFLFTLTLPFLIVVPRGRRLWIGYLAASIAVFAWACTFWVDRNLQTFLPLLAAATGAIIVRVWDLGWVARLGLVPLIGLQIAWGAAFMFNGSDRLASAVDLIRSGIDGQTARRFSRYRAEFRAVGDAIPTHVITLLHDYHLSLGINRTTYLDWIGFQGLIDYRSFRTPRDAYDRFKTIGIAYIVRAPGSRTAASKQEEVVFDAFAALYAKPKGRFGNLELLEMPSVPPPEQRPFRVLTVSIGQYRNGIYPIEALSTCEEMPPEKQVYARPDVPIEGRRVSTDLLARVDAVLLSTSAILDESAQAVLDAQFRPVSQYGGDFAVYVRTAPQGS